MYVRKVCSVVARPEKELKAFAKPYIAAGKTVTVGVVLDKSAFTYWSDINQKWETEDGVYEIKVAASASDLKLIGKIFMKEGKITVL